MSLQQLALEDLKTGRYEFIGSVPIGESWMKYGEEGKAWLRQVAEEEAPPGASGFFLGEYHMF